LETPEGVRGFALTAVPGDAAALPDSTGARLLPVLGLALLGGLLLNLMPCVFPVLSIKALSLAQSAGHARRTQALHGISYTAGVLASFTLVAAVLLALRAGGAAIGWGFQLQSPLFVGALALVMFALALSLSGVIDFGTRWMGVGDRLAAAAGYRGSFFTGVLATVVASPCTAPFMGAALGFAVVQPPGVALTVFLTLGLGMALPFLALGLLPGLGRLLPRPGAWMDTFKQAMAFPLYLTVVWLLWVLGRQTGVDGMAAALLGLVTVALALWWWGRAPGSRPLLRRIGVLALLAFAVAALRIPALIAPDEAAAGADHQGFSAERLAELRSAGRVVFVNMTADWCITCLVNEQVALNTDTVRRAFAAHEVAYLKGDWTRHDPAITEYLAGYGRNGVPHYVVYRPGQDGRVLPQILTAGLVVEALERR
jgi:thiol:disulfide interchange protein